MNEPTDYVKPTEENTQPSDSHYDELGYMTTVVDIGISYKALFEVFKNPNPQEHYDARDEMWIGMLPVYYAGEVVGYFREEDEVVFYHKAELKDKS